MSNMQFTPGPLVPRKTYSGRSIVPTWWVAPEGEYTQAVAKIMRGAKFRKEYATLFAQAPAMYEALEVVDKAAGDFWERTPGMSDNVGKLGVYLNKAELMAIRAVLKAARGEA